MKYLLSTTLLFAVLLLGVSVGMAQESTMSKAETQYWKKKAKMYSKRPAALKAEFDNLEEQIESLKKKNKTLEGSGGMMVGDMGDGTLDSLRWVIAQQEGEFQSLEDEFSKLKEAYRTNRTVTERGLKEGLIYRVQIGAYVLEDNVQYDNLQDEKFSVERSDGMYKYILGAFRSMEEAERFRGKLMQMGMNDPWIVPYIDGIRVSMDEARDYNSGEATDTYYLDRN